MDARDPERSRPLDAAIGLAATAAGAGISLTRGMLRAATPLGRTLLHPPLVSARLHPARIVDALARRGREVMASPHGDFERLVAIIVPAVVREVLDALDINALIRERIDLVELVASVDMAEIIDRIDIDAIVRQVDLDALVQRVDVNAVAEHLDLDAVAERIDLDRIVTRIDVVGIAEKVLDEIDLPEIIRESTGSVASDVVRDARIKSVAADELISRLADRLLGRRQGRLTDTHGRPPAAAALIVEGESGP